MAKIVLINISGEDKPGVTAALMRVLSNYQVTVLDIGQAVIHDFLSLGILAHIPDGAESSPVLEKILFQVYELGLNAKFSPVSEKDYEHWVGSQGKDRHIITILGRTLPAAPFSKIAAVIADNGLNIDVITRLSGRNSLQRKQRNPRACVELSVRGKPRNVRVMRARFMEISQDTGLDIAFQPDDIYRRNRRLVVFDMDSTLIQVEVLDELAKAHGVGRKVSAITKAAMNGEMDFRESLKKRVQLLKGLDALTLGRIAKRLPLTEGTERLTSTLKALGYKLAIISGGFSYFGTFLQQKLGFDYVYANELEIQHGVLTGKCVGDIIDGKRKAELLAALAKKEQISLAQTIAVGDGANDLPMLDLAGLGIAFHAKPVVKQNVKQSISTLGLDAVLYLIGIRDRELVA